MTRILVENLGILVPSKNGIFETANFGTSGEITLDEYKPRLRCKHDVLADTSCSEIKISYRSIAVMMDYISPTCPIDGFRFGWTDNETGNFSVTPPRCNCFGDGCTLNPELEYYFDYAKNNRFYDDYQDQHLGPEELTINSNSFTLYFESSPLFDNGGHVILDWECVATTTTTTTSTSTTISTTSTLTTTTLTTTT